MGQVTLTLNGRSYRLACGEGEEERLQGLCGHLRGHVDKIKGDFGQIGDERLLLMAALMVTDELWEARECLAAAETALKSPARRSPVAGVGPTTLAGPGGRCRSGQGRSPWRRRGKITERSAGRRARERPGRKIG